MAAFPLVEAVRVLVSPSGPVLYGDQALLDLGARRAIQLDQLVGPYSRAGFHQPGPAAFYLLAPFVRILEPSAAGLYLGAIAVNGAALTATVVVLWRRHGPMVALWAAAAIDLFCLCVRVGTLREPWNPYLVIAPMVLFVVLWAESVSGARAAGIWALVVGSYEVQTHIATGAFVAVMSVILLAWLARSRWGRRRDRGEHRDRRTPAGIAGAAALALIWVAPVVELWRDHPNNLRLLWDVFTSPPATPPLSQALRVAADAVTILPFGYHDYDLTLHRTGAEIAGGGALIVIGLIVAVVAWRRRRQPTSLALIVASVLGLAIGTASLTRTAGPVYLYFAVWMAFIPLALLLAIGIAVVGQSDELQPARASTTRRRAGVQPPGSGRARLPVLLAAALAASTLVVQSDLRMGAINTTIGSGPWPAANAGTQGGRTQTVQVTAVLTEAADRVLQPNDRWVNITIGTASLWPYAAGLVLGLDERGIQSTVAPGSWSLYFGSERAPGRRVEAVFDLFASSDRAAGPAARGRVIAAVDGAVLTYQTVQPPR